MKAGKSKSDRKTHAAGMKVRRKILGDAHVDRAIKASTPTTREFQDLIVRYGWGEVWTRPGMDLHTRRILVIGTMMAIGRWEEFRLHARAALEAGMPVKAIKEILLQQMIYCGIPVGNNAFHHLEEIIAELKAKRVKVKA